MRESDPASPRSVLVIDSHPITRLGVKNLLEKEPELQFVGEAGTRTEAFRRLREGVVPDVIVVDPLLEGVTDGDLVRDLHRRSPSSAILIFTLLEECPYGLRMLEAGARGFIMKTQSGDRLADAIRRVAAGRVFLSVDLAEQLVEKAGNGESESTHVFNALSNRELTVFELISIGLGPKEIAERLRLSVKTVETHRRHLKQKLHTQTSSELLQYSIRWRQTQAR